MEKRNNDKQKITMLERKSRTGERNKDRQKWNEERKTNNNGKINDKQKHTTQT